MAILTVSIGIGLILLASIGAIQIPTSNLNSTTVIDASYSRDFNYILTIVLENQGLSNTYGANCSGNCTYITKLANANGLAENYSDVAHPSLPNYLALLSGGNYDYPPFNQDCYPMTNGCQISTVNLVDNMEKVGKTWKAYVEDYNGGCTNTGDKYYVNNHNPFVYFTDIYNNTNRCNRIVNANLGNSGYLALPTVLLSDLNSTLTASNYMWLTPNVCDDGHNSCGPANNAVSQQNKYLSMLVPLILNSVLFRTQNAVLFITWDEASVTSSNTVTAIWAGVPVRSGYQSTNAYSHYSLVKTLETEWHLAALTTNDWYSLSMTDFFTASFNGGGRHLSKL